MGSQDQQQANMLSHRDKPPKVRHRASVACSACRERRTRCVVPAGQQQCIQCKDAGQDCVIRHDDERRKPNSKAYVNSLRDRIAHLESLLDDKETRSSPGSQESNADPQDGQAPQSAAFDFAIPQLSDHDMSSFLPQEVANDSASPANSTFSSTSTGSRFTISRLLSTKGHLGFDQLSGRLRWFGGTYNIHVLSDIAGETQENNRQAMEQARRTQRVLSTLSRETQDYLMAQFWQHYNSVIHIIHEAAFKEGLAEGSGRFYSPFLHIVILAMGFRHADKDRPDVVRISLPGKESTLHREAKYMLDYELERPGGVTTIQALLLLGDLECGVGRDNLGWLISGMAMRILFDAGLHLANPTGLSQTENDIGRMTLWACVIYDRYWALFLGRPTALKPDDLEVYRLAQQFERLGTLEPAGPTKNLEKQIYEGLLDLMELAGKITEIMDKASQPSVRLDQHVYITASALTHELEAWYSRLPPPLQWTPENIEGAPASYFLLHQQYHAAIILLHRQFAQYDDIVSHSSDQGSENGDESSHFATLSRMKCTRSAGRMAQIFWQHRQCYDMKKIFVTGLQHAGTAAIALIAAVASPKDRTSRDVNMRYLECLALSIEEMAETYQPAERMSAVLKAVLEELKSALPPESSTIPARRASPGDAGVHATTAKRHQTGRPKAKRTTSQLQLEPVGIQELPRRHTTTGMPPPSLPLSNQLSANQDELSFPTTVGTGMEASTAWMDSDESNLFSVVENGFSSEFNRAPSPGPMRSAWMGASTPSFSPLPSGTSNQAFLNPPLPELNDSEKATEGQNSQQDLFNTHANLDFMALLGPSEAADSFDALTHTKSAPRKTHKDDSTKANVTKSRSRTRMKPDRVAEDENDASQGFSTTLAGLDDIWKEMMKTSQVPSITAK